VVQATMQRGFTNLLTGYAGAEASQGYGAVLLGSALNTRYGAFAMDVTSAHTQIPGLNTLSGQSVRLNYSKIMAQTGTALSVAAYRYSTSGYLSLGDAARARDYARRGLPVFASGAAQPLLINGVPISGLLTPAQQAALVGVDPGGLLAPTGVDRLRNNFSLTLSQQLGQRSGSLYVNGSVRDYWNRGGTDSQFQLGYNNTIGPVSYNLSASRERDLFGRSDNRYMINVTIPLGNGEHAPLFTGGLSHDSTGDTQQQATLNGTAGVDNRYSYGATATHDSGGQTGSVGSTGSINGGYRGTQVQLNAGFGAGHGYSQASLSVAGGIVAHPGGITFGQSLGDTMAIIEAPEAVGARVGNAAGVRVDRSGYALVPYLTPYVLDTINIDPSGLPLDVQLDNTSSQVAPRAGAVVLVKFKGESGRFLLIQAHLADGGTLPFGAEVQNEQGQPVGMVGQAGRIMVRVQRASGRLDVQWQDAAGSSHQCQFAYHSPATPAGNSASRYMVQDATCDEPRVPAVSKESSHE
jgi:outer membrane usher protein